MSAPGTGWRLPLRLAWRDLMRYKGRSALAALLILLPVAAMAGTITFGTTENVDESENRAQMYKTARAYVSFNGAEPGAKTTPFPAAGREVSPQNPPTEAEVSKQAGAPATAETTAGATFNPAPDGATFTPVDGQYFAADLHSPIVGDTVTVAEGRLPRTGSEVVVTDLGRSHGLPSHGPIKIAGSMQDQSLKTVTVVGVVHTRLPSITAAGPIIPAVTGNPAQFAIGAPARFTKERIDEWARYGAAMESVDYVPPSYDSDDSSTVIAILTATMAFICVTAMLAAPAFAAGATRHRRTLGLIASNGGTRSNLRRVVLAQALLLGALTAVVACALGAVAGVFVGRWWSVRSQGVTPPVDIRFTWLLGLVGVSTIASLVAALIPARSAGRTNLLAALRGQVSSRTVKKRWPTIGVIMIALAALCLFAALTMADHDDGDGLATLLVIVGMPLLFGGAVLAVPYLLMLTGFLARRLPLTSRLAVRDVSRQRTRATASIGAILATVAVFSGGSVVASSVDAFEAKQYHPSRPVGTGSFDMSGSTKAPTDAQVAEAVRNIKNITGDATPHWWQNTTEHTRVLGLPGRCAKGKVAQNYPTITAVDPADVHTLGLTDAQRAVLTEGGVLVVGPIGSDENITYADGGPGTSLTPGDIKNGKLTLPIMTTGGMRSDGGLETTSCSNTVLSAAQVPHKVAWTSLNVWPGTVVMARPTAARLHLPVTFSNITVAPKGGIDGKMESQLQALAPLSMRLTVEHPRKSLLQKILMLVTAAFALIVLLTTVVSTLLNDAESQADAATLATVGAPTGMRRRIVGAQAFVLGFLGAGVGIVVGLIPGFLLARSATRPAMSVGDGPWSERMSHGASTYAIPWWPLAVMLVAVPLVAALISMVFARRNPTLTRRER